MSACQAATATPTPKTLPEIAYRGSYTDLCHLSRNNFPLCFGRMWARANHWTDAWRCHTNESDAMRGTSNTFRRSLPSKYAFGWSILEKIANCLEWMKSMSGTSGHEPWCVYLLAYRIAEANDRTKMATTTTTKSASTNFWRSKTKSEQQGLAHFWLNENWKKQFWIAAIVRLRIASCYFHFVCVSSSGSVYVRWPFANVTMSPLRCAQAETIFR